ncbi:MAG: HNH endonuclease, partial [Erythrobacter sp.]
RSPERRLTDNLGPLRNVATRDDIVLFNKDLTDDGFIQIHLLRKGTAEYDKLNSRLGSQRWGIVDPDHPPVSLREIEEATVYIDDKISKPAKAFGDDRATKEVISIRKARDRAFRERVLSQYEYRCAFTSRKFVSPSSSKTVGLDAAHIVPVDLNGSDHPANGLALSKDMHWAFDRGLVGISKDRTVFVSKKVGDLDGNEFLRDLHGKPIGQTTNPGLGVLEEALEWHRSNVLIT